MDCGTSGHVPAAVRPVRGGPSPRRVLRPTVDAVSVDAEVRRGPSPPVKPWPVRAALVYSGLVVVPLVLVLVAMRVGRGLDAGVPAGPAGTGAAGPDPYPRLLLALPAILGACHLVGRLFEKLSQPRVIGEIVTGVLLGPSMFGLVWPAGFGWLFPAYLVPSINLLGQLGLVLFMFLVGLEMNLLFVRRRRYTAALVSHVSIAVPLLSGLGLALAMYRPLGGDVGFPAFGLFLAVSMSVTAFPVLARILSDRKLADTPLGSTALTCAAVDDVTAWCLLAVVSAVARHRSAGGVWVTVALSVGFAVLMLCGLRSVLGRLMTPAAGRLAPEPAVLPVLLSGVLLSALATHTIGIHPIFGAFLFGVITPRDVEPVRRAAEQVRGVTSTLLLPLFFVSVGLRTRFGLLLADGRLWAWYALVTAVAVVGKLVGSAVAARLTGVGWAESLSLGVLMNCRGLTELVVLSVGLDLRVISPTVFAMLVLMTLVSTLLTSPGLSAIAALAGRTAPPAPPLGALVRSGRGRSLVE